MTSPPPSGTVAGMTQDSHGTHDGVGTVRLNRRRPAPPAGLSQVRETALVIDCGSSSVRAFIAEITDEHARILEDMVHPVDLTAGFTGGKLDRVAMDLVVQAVCGIIIVAKGYGVTRIRAVATSALREANNSDVLVERLRTTCSVDLDVIDGSEAVRLYFEALRRTLNEDRRTLQGNTLLMDIGAGCTSAGLIRQGKLVYSVDEHYGTVRLSDAFQELRDSLDYSVTIDRFSTGAARMMLSRLPSRTVSTLVFTGGEVRRLVTLTGNETGGIIETLEPEALERLWTELAPLSPAKRAERCCLPVYDAARILPALALIRHLIELSGADKILVPQMTLRDGMLADLLPGAQGAHHLEPEHVLAEAKQLVSRYGGDLPYAENTAQLAVQLFDQTVELHNLGARERLLLEFAAVVHDIGSYINVRNRHKHTMYIIQSADIAGLTRPEQDIVANVARYHRKSPPEPHHQDFMALPRRARVTVAYLAAILRLAYALDVERSQRIKKVRCVVDGERLLLHVDRRQIALERWSLAGKIQLFREVFGLDVVIIPRGEF